MKKKRRVYLDYAATVPVFPEVVQAMASYWTTKFGNPSSVHYLGQEARLAIDQSRAKIAGLLHCSPSEIIFTGTTTTSVNLALQGTALALQGKGNHLITSRIEHQAVLATVKGLERSGFTNTLIGVDQYGQINLSNLEKAINKDTIIVSTMYANNEVGTIQPIKKIARIVRQKEEELQTKIYFHVDGAACVGWLDLNLDRLDVDLFTLGAHKFGGPKGIGLLYAKKGTPIKPVLFGGHHEAGLWPGTEAAPLIVGMAKALEITLDKRKTVEPKARKLQDLLIKGMLQVPQAELTGHPENRLADIASFIIKGVEGEALLLYLSDKGIAASSGSACTSGELKPSHVLLAMGIQPELAHGSLRFSLGAETSKEDIDYVLAVLPKVVEKLRKIRKGIR
ncbi:MAG: cysteine desulfurase family protein [Candidatus Shapirobacteria bacterium]